MLNRLKNRIRGFLARKQAVILTYHTIRTLPMPFPVWHHLDAHCFETQIAYLARHFRCVPMPTLLNEMATGDISPYTIAITFDDGYRDNLTVALPVLQRFRVPATLFLTTGFVGGTRLLWPERVACTLALTTVSTLHFSGKRYPLADNTQKGVAYRQLAQVFKSLHPAVLEDNVSELLRLADVTPEQLCASEWHRNLLPLSWQEVQTLRASGLFCFGAHTMTHRRLSALSDAEAEHEIAEPKRILEQRIGPIDYFAYPYGGPDDFCSQHREMAIRSGYTAIFTASANTVTAQNDPYSVPRVGLGFGMAQDEFAYLVHGGVARSAFV